jgi:hypothetical protein
MQLLRYEACKVKEVNRYKRKDDYRKANTNLLQHVSMFGMR